MSRNIDCKSLIYHFLQILFYCAGVLYENLLVKARRWTNWAQTPSTLFWPPASGCCSRRGSSVLAKLLRNLQRVASDWRKETPSADYCRIAGRASSKLRELVQIHRSAKDDPKPLSDPDIMLRRLSSTRCAHTFLLRTSTYSQLLGLNEFGVKN